MNNYERTCDMVNAYVKEHGRISFNLYNNGLKDFPGPCLCLMYVFENDKFRLVGADYRPTCNVIQYKGRRNEQVVGKWNNGIFSFLPTPIPTEKMN